MSLLIVMRELAIRIAQRPGDTLSVVVGLRRRESARPLRQRPQVCPVEGVAPNDQAQGPLRQPLCCLLMCVAFRWDMRSFPARYIKAY